MLVMVGASASGKTEIAKILIAHYNFKKMITYTTRDLRDKEVNGVDYHFISLDDFLDKQANHYFLETSLYNGKYYGTAFKDAEIDKVLIVDPNGANSIHQKQMEQIVIFYLKTKKPVREDRMILRGDGLEDIRKRLNMDDKLFQTENLIHVDFEIDTSTLSQSELAGLINNMYKIRLGL